MWSPVWHAPLKPLCLPVLLLPYSVAVPELLAAVGQQVQLLAAAAAAAEAAAAPLAAPAEAPAADTAAAPAGSAPLATVPTQPLPPTQQVQQPQAAPSEVLSLAGISSLLASHLRLGYAPPPLLLNSLAPQIRRLAPTSPGEDAGRLLQLLAAVPYSPGLSVVQLLLGRVLDEDAAAEQGGSGASLAAAQAAEQLLGVN